MSNIPCGHTLEHRGESITYTGLPSCPYCKIDSLTQASADLRERYECKADELNADRLVIKTY